MARKNMAQPAIKDPLLDELDQLPQDLQCQVRELVHTLAVPGVSVPPEGLRFAIDSPLDRQQVAEDEGKWAGEGPLLLPDARPDSTVKQILTLISDGQLLSARRIAVEAAVRFPDHAKLRTARRMLAGGGNPSLSSRGPEPSTDEEFSWLRSPPEWARGKWVALIGREAVASADTLVELVESLKSMDLPRRPLVHRID